MLSFFIDKTEWSLKEIREGLKVGGITIEDLSQSNTLDKILYELMKYDFHHNPYVEFDMTVQKHTEEGKVIGKLHYSGFLNTVTEYYQRSGYPDNGGSHSLCLKLLPEEVFKVLREIEHKFGRCDLFDDMFYWFENEYNRWDNNKYSWLKRKREKEKSE